MVEEIFSHYRRQTVRDVALDLKSLRQGLGHERSGETESLPVARPGAFLLADGRLQSRELL